jgi:hypothetical protein
VRFQQIPEVDPDQFIAVQREDGPLLAPVRRGEAKAAAAAQRLRLAEATISGPSPASSLSNNVSEPWAQATITRVARIRKPNDLVRGERAARD